jgi:hypothetical protein
MDTTDGWTTPLGDTHSDDERAHKPPQAPPAIHGQLKSPMEPTGHFGSGLGVNDSSRTPAPLAPAPAAGGSDYGLPTGHFGSGLGATESSRAAWEEAARRWNSHTTQASGAPQCMDLCTSPFLDAPVGDTIGNQLPMQDGHCQNGQESWPASKSQYQDGHGYDMASGYTRPHHPNKGLSGGCISSPYHANCRQQAMANKVSPLDIAGLGDKCYHGGDKGYVPLTMNIVHRCGYMEINLSDFITSYQNIIHVHNFVLEQWEDRYHNLGPQVGKILEKGLHTFPSLSTIDVESTVDFYDIFQKTSMIYLLPIMPFDCISIKMGYKALCPPGMGLPHYETIAWVLMEILPRLLPKAHTRITSLINMVRMESGNGYDLLWRILSLLVPGFDPTLPVILPTWFDGDVFKFAHSFHLYYCLQAKKGVVSDDQTQSVTFLNSIQELLYADVVTTLTTCIKNYSPGNKDRYLPANLCVMGLALQIYKHAQSHAQMVIPRVRRTIGWHDEYDSNVPIQGAPWVVQTNGAV